MDEMEYYPDLITLVDDEGNEQEFEFVDELEHNGNLYYALIPVLEDSEEIVDSDGDLVVLKAQVEGDEELLATIDDDEEYFEIGNIFIERLEALYSEEDEAE